MARGVNKVILIGNLGRDPETRSFPSGGMVANVSLATTDNWKDRETGELKSATEWHNLVFRNRLAEIAGQYLRKGSKIYVEGAIRTRKWQDQQGQDRYTTEINVREMQMLDGRNDGSGGNKTTTISKTLRKAVACKARRQRQRIWVTTIFLFESAMTTTVIEA